MRKRQEWPGLFHFDFFQSGRNFSNLIGMASRILLGPALPGRGSFQGEGRGLDPRPGGTGLRCQKKPGRRPRQGGMIKGIMLK